VPPEHLPGRALVRCGGTIHHLSVDGREPPAFLAKPKPRSRPAARQFERRPPPDSKVHRLQLAHSWSWPHRGHGLDGLPEQHDSLKVGGSLVIQVHPCSGTDDLVNEQLLEVCVRQFHACAPLGSEDRRTAGHPHLTRAIASPLLLVDRSHPGRARLSLAHRRSSLRTMVRGTRVACPFSPINVHLFVRHKD